jgi:hypothetical protein
MIGNDTAPEAQSMSMKLASASMLSRRPATVSAVWLLSA